MCQHNVYPFLHFPIVLFRFLVGPVMLFVLVFYVVFFVLFVFVLCLLYPMLPVSMDCSFLIAPSVSFFLFFYLLFR